MARPTQRFDLDQHNIGHTMADEKGTTKTAKLIDEEIENLKKELELQSQKVHFSRASHIEVMDRIHTREKIKISKKIAALREALRQGITCKEKTY